MNMNNSVDQIRKTIINYLSSCQKKENSHYIVTLCSLLEQVSQTHNISIDEPKEREFFVQGTDGYHIIATTLFFLVDMERNHIIHMFRNNNGKSHKYKINDKCELLNNPERSKITGDLNDFLNDNRQANIWISPEFDWFEKHGFMSKEIVEAKRQTRYAFWTLFLAIISYVCTTLPQQISQICNSPLLLRLYELIKNSLSL